MASNATKKASAGTKTADTKKKAADTKTAASKKGSTSGSSRSKSKTAAVGMNKENETQVRFEREPEYAGPFLMKEAAMWLMLAFCILLFISYFGIGGYVGGAVSDICFGVFGVCAYLFPVLLFVGTAFLVSNRGSRIAGLKLGASVLLYLCICSFAALVTGAYEEATTAIGLYNRSAAYKSGGGVTGGMVCRLLCPALGTAGTGVLLLVLSIICLVLITQRSLMRIVRNQSSKMMQSARESSARRREAYEEEKRRREEWNRFETETLPQRDTKRRTADLEISGTPQLWQENADRRSAEPGNHAGRRTVRVERVVPDTRRRRKALRGASVQNADWRGPKDRRPQPEAGEQTVSYEISRDVQPQEVRPGRSGRTEIEVPIIFSPNKRGQSRRDRRASGVAIDMKISAASSGMEEKQEPALDREDQSRTASAGYIDLGEVREQKRRKEAHTAEERPGCPSGMEAVGDNQDEGGAALAAEEELLQSLHIEGIAENTEPGPQPETGRKGHTALTEETDPQAAAGQEGGKETEIVGADGLYDRNTSFEAYVREEKAERQESPEEIRNPKRSSGVRAHDFAADIFRKEDTEEAPSSAGTVFRSTGGAAGKAGKAASSAGNEPNPSGHGAEDVPSKRNPRSSEKEIAEGIASVEAEMAKAAEAVRPEYVFPPLDLLKKGKNKSNGGQEQEIRRTAAKLQQTLNSFGVHVTVTNVSCGPSVTRYELLPEQGVKVSRIVGLSDDIKLNLAAADIRIEAPIPGKSAVGIEVPNAENSAVALRDLIESEEFQNHPSRLAFATGKDIGGKVVVSDIAKMPHLLIAGATGSGKSVCINTLIMSILYKANPDDVKLIMIDPKVVELSVYNGIPHLFIPVVTDPKKAAGALNWAVAEMTDRYNKFAEYAVRDLKGYNQKVEALADVDDPNKPKKLPQIVIIVDELADLMMVAPGEVEDSICRLAQLARAAGIHLIIATQRPSVNVITGLIKANMPSRIAFSVSSGVDSRTIIDMNGAEKLLGKGDMLFYPQGYQKPARVQGAFVSDEEVADVVDFLKNKNMNPSYSAEMEEQIAKVQKAGAAARSAEDTDELFAEAGRFIIEKDKASIGMLQRVFKIGFNRAARIMDQLSDAGVVGPEEGTKPRRILMSAEQFENYLEEN